MVAHRAPGPVASGSTLTNSAQREPGMSRRARVARGGWPVLDKPIHKTAHDLGGIHALIVEDNGDSREVLRLALQYCGALVTSVATASEAESLLSELRPHVLVTDINMPDDGVALIRAVRAVTAAHGFRVPTIAVTAAGGAAGGGLPGSHGEAARPYRAVPRHPAEPAEAGERGR